MVVGDCDSWVVVVVGCCRGNGGDCGVGDQWLWFVVVAVFCLVMAAVALSY